MWGTICGNAEGTSTGASGRMMLIRMLGIRSRTGDFPSPKPLSQPPSCTPPTTGYHLAFCQLPTVLLKQMVTAQASVSKFISSNTPGVSRPLDQAARVVLSKARRQTYRCLGARFWSNMRQDNYLVASSMQIRASTFASYLYAHFVITLLHFRLEYAPYSVQAGAE